MNKTQLLNINVVFKCVTRSFRGMFNNLDVNAFYRRVPKHWPFLIPGCAYTNLHCCIGVKNKHISPLTEAVIRACCTMILITS